VCVVCVDSSDLHPLALCTAASNRLRRLIRHRSVFGFTCSVYSARNLVTSTLGSLPQRLRPEWTTMTPQLVGACSLHHFVSHDNNIIREGAEGQPWGWGRGGLQALRSVQLHTVRMARQRLDVTERGSSVNF
jgi:hypothetical protein